MTKGHASGRARSVGGVLQEWRTRRRLSYRALAELVPCEHSLLWKIEHGMATLTRGMAEKCDEALRAGGALVAACVALDEGGTEVLPRPAQLPPAGAWLVGRHAELASLERGTFHNSTPSAGGTPVVIVIDGPAGCGKTALALRWAHEISRHFPDGQLYANLGGSDEPDRRRTIDEVLDDFLYALGSRPTPAHIRSRHSRVAQFRSLSAGRRLLIVLDDVADAAAVEEFLPANPGCCVIATSRRALPGLVARVGATRVAAVPLSEPDAIALCQRIIGNARASGESEAIRRVVRQCGGLPLALRAAAEQITMYAHRSIADFADEFCRDDTPRLDLLELAYLRRAFSRAYGQVAADVKQILQLVGLHGGATVHISALAAMDGITTGQARRLVAQAFSVHLIDLGPGDTVRVPPLMRDYLREQTDLYLGTAHRVSAVRRLAIWYMATARSASRHLADNAPMEQSSRTPLIEPLTFVDRASARAWAEIEAANVGLIINLIHECGPSAADKLARVFADIGLLDLASDTARHHVTENGLALPSAPSTQRGAGVVEQLAASGARPSSRQDPDDAPPPFGDAAFAGRTADDDEAIDLLRRAALHFLPQHGVVGRRATDQLWAALRGQYEGIEAAIPGPRFDHEKHSTPGDRPDVDDT